MVKRRNPGQIRNPRMQDVADMAKVGVATVSRAFSEPEKVSKDALRRIERAVAKLNYIPNVSAQTLRAHTTGRVLVMIPMIGNIFFTPIMEGMTEVASAAERVILLGDSRRGIGPGRSYTSRSYMTQLAVGRADALILLDGSLPIEFNNASDRTTEPVIAVSERSISDAVPFVGIDNEKAAFEITMYLGEMGHRHFAHIAGRDGSTTASARESGFRKAMAALGVGEKDFIVERGDFTIMSGRETVERILSLPELPTGVFCSSDDIAFVAMHEFSKAGIRVPDDISLVGIDDVEMAHLINPGLTTIRQPRYEMGRVGMQIIVDQLEGRLTKIEDVVLPHKLVIRDSVAPPRSKRGR